MTERTELANTLLEKAGWFPGRKVDLEVVRITLALRGIMLSRGIETFLEEFDKIHFSDDTISSTGYEEIIDIDAALHSQVEDDEIEELEKIKHIYNVDLVRIGWSHCAQAQILMCQKGNVWLSFLGLDASGIVEGHDWNEFVNNVLVKHWNLYRKNQS
jgi:hypothetical protein